MTLRLLLPLPKDWRIRKCKFSSTPAAKPHNCVNSWKNSCPKHSKISIKPDSNSTKAMSNSSAPPNKLKTILPAFKMDSLSYSLLISAWPSSNGTKKTNTQKTSNKCANNGSSPSEKSDFDNNHSLKKSKKKDKVVNSKISKWITIFNEKQS